MDRTSGIEKEIPRDSIYIKMFNTPEVIKNGVKITFPYRKVEALLYYMVIKKQATREELVNLLWSENDEEIAKKNLRNAIYKIKKLMELDILLSPQKFHLILNPEINIQTDLEQFLSGKEGWLDAYKGEFLQGFFIKNEKNFEEWMMSERESYKDIYISRLEKKLEDELSKKSYLNAEHYAKLLINADEFNERAVRNLMKIYALQGEFDKAVSLFSRLQDTLNKELQIEPEMETKNLLKEIMNMREYIHQGGENGINEYFFGRHAEMDTLIKNFECFRRGEEAKSIILIGEAGIGKTYLKNQFLKHINQGKEYVLEANCYYGEHDFPLKPWNAISSKLARIIQNENIEISSFYREILTYFFPAFADESGKVNTNFEKELDMLKYEIVEKAVIDTLNKIARRKKILLVFEDMQWMDEMSISLLRSIILHQEKNNIIFIGTCRNGNDKKLDRLIVSTIRYEKVIKIELKRFTCEEVHSFIKKFLPALEMDRDTLDKIYDETEGNPFFMMECIRSIQKNGEVVLKLSQIEDILKNRFIDISEEGKKILNIVSMFPKEAPLEIVQRLSGKDEFDMMRYMEELENRGILQENNHTEIISFSFTHKKLREFVYMQQSPAWRKLLHDRIGNILEKFLKEEKNDPNVYPNIIYHYQNARNELQALNYMIEQAGIYLDLNHEIFPVLNPIALKGTDYIFNHEKTFYCFEQIEKLLEKVRKGWNQTEKVIKLEAKYLHIKGRYLIFCGNYDEGITCIYSLIENSRKIDYVPCILKGYRQIIYYARQIHDTNLMQEYLERSLKIAREIDDSVEIAALIRLKGLNRLLEGDYESAEKELRKSVELFRKLDVFEEKYSLNIAAAYNYMGEIQMLLKNYKDALKYFNYAINIGKKGSILQSNAVFYLNAGRAAYKNEDITAAREYFLNALSIYSKIDFIWGRAVVEGCMFLLYMGERKFKEALEALRKAEHYSRRLKNPDELRFVYQIKTEIGMQIKKDKTFREEIFAYLKANQMEWNEKLLDFTEKKPNKPYI